MALDPSVPAQVVIDKAGKDADLATTALIGLLGRGAACSPDDIRVLRERGALFARWHRVVRWVAEEDFSVPHPRLSTWGGDVYQTFLDSDGPGAEPIVWPEGRPEPGAASGPPRGTAFWLALEHCPDLTAARTIADMLPGTATIGFNGWRSNPFFLLALERFAHASPETKPREREKVLFAVAAVAAGSDERYLGHHYGVALVGYLNTCLASDHARANCTSDEGVEIMDAILSARDDVLQRTSEQSELTLGHILGLAIRLRSPRLAGVVATHHGEVGVNAGRYQKDLFGLSPSEILLAVQASDPEPARWATLLAVLSERGDEPSTGSELATKLAEAPAKGEQYMQRLLAEVEEAERRAWEKAWEAQRLRQEQKDRAFLYKRCIASGANGQSCGQDPKAAFEAHQDFKAHTAAIDATRAATPLALYYTISVSSDESSASQGDGASPKEYPCGATYRDVPPSFPSFTDEDRASVDRFYDKHPDCPRPGGGERVPYKPGIYQQ